MKKLNIPFLVGLLLTIVGLFTGLLPLALVGFLILVPTFLRFLLGLALSIVGTYYSPFATIHKALNNALPGANEDYTYKNKKEFILYYIVGNYVYYFFLAFMAILVLFYRPYDEGHIYKQYTFQTGDIVCINTEEGKELASVESFSMDENGCMSIAVSYKGNIHSAYTSVLDKSGPSSVCFKISGVYKEGDGFVAGMVKSLWNWLSCSEKQVTQFIKNRI